MKTLGKNKCCFSLKQHSLEVFWSRNSKNLHPSSIQLTLMSLSFFNTEIFGFYNGTGWYFHWKVCSLTEILFSTRFSCKFNTIFSTIFEKIKNQCISYLPNKYSPGNYFYTKDITPPEIFKKSTFYHIFTSFQSWWAIFQINSNLPVRSQSNDIFTPKTFYLPFILKRKWRSP